MNDTTRRPSPERGSASLRFLPLVAAGFCFAVLAITGFGWFGAHNGHPFGWLGLGLFLLVLADLAAAWPIP